MHRLFLTLLIPSLWLAGLRGQDSLNIIPNPDFEKYSGVPLGWFYSGKDFTRVMKFWSSPTAASPDVYGPKVYVPRHWRDKGFGSVKPKSGESMVGITTYGCTEGKPHCREYLQIQLAEPLVPGQRYEVSFWYQPLANSIKNNQLGICFTREAVQDLTDSLLELHTHIDATRILGQESVWHQYKTEWIPDFEGQYMVMGNFKSDAETKRHAPGAEAFGFGYYYIDAFDMHKLPPILEVPVPEDDLTRIKLEKGKTVRLKNIYFDFDRTELLPLSYIELNKLLGLLEQNPHMEIEIRGHTDNSGTDAYNRDLSFDRARAVTNYLRSKGIAKERISLRGYGAESPIASNRTAEGRQKNRRVEFYISKFE